MNTLRPTLTDPSRPPYLAFVQASSARLAGKNDAAGTQWSTAFAVLPLVLLSAIGYHLCTLPLRCLPPPPPLPVRTFMPRSQATNSIP